MTKASWLLELAVELRQPLWLFAHPEIELAVNRPCPKLTLEELSRLLDELRRDGLICFTADDRQRLTPSKDELFARLQKRDSTYYGLTPEGGAAWETFAHPDWNCFIDASADEAEVVAVCADRDRLEQFVRSRWQQWCPVERERHDILSPWVATYWQKVLPVGHRLQYSYRDLDQSNFSAQDHVQRNAWLGDMNTWFERIDINLA